MGWEKRAGRRYYYRKRRQGLQVRSEYVGMGELADALATLDALERERDDLAHIELREECKMQHAVDAWLDQFIALTRMIVAAELTNHGYHQHRGQWRKRRDE